MKKNKIWRRLDNAALIFPATKRSGWINRFRISANLKEDIDKKILQDALNHTIKRFPLICASLHKGLFWYYLEQVDSMCEVTDDNYEPTMPGHNSSIRKCAIRVLIFKNRMAVEFFHSVADGNSGLIFVKSLLAEYIELKYHVEIPKTFGVKDLNDEPSEEELEDSFDKYKGQVVSSRYTGKSYVLKGEKEVDDYYNLTCATMSVKELKAEASKYQTTITVYLTAVMLEALLKIEKEQVKNPKKYLPVKVQIPVNLRKLFPSETLRNFVMVVNVGIDPKQGMYTFEEIVECVKHQFGLFITPKAMRGSFTTNVNSSKSPFIKIIPLFIKNIVMKAIFDSVGENQACLNLSNLGQVELPDELKEYVEYFDFIIGPQSKAPYNTSVCSFGDILRFNMINNSKENYLEQAFFTSLVKKHIHVKIESTRRCE